MPGVHASQKITLGLLELELQMVVSHMWVLGTEPGPSVKAKVLLTIETFLQAPCVNFLKYKEKNMETNISRN